MTERFFIPGAQRAQKVQELFTTIAPRYDLINDLQSFGLHRIWKRRAIEVCRVEPGISALDVCCGTGDLARSLARLGANTIGLDFNERMLAVAEAKQRANNGKGRGGTLRFLRGDALELPFEANSFDVVTVGYGLRNLADLGRGLKELERVTRPGGRVVVLDFGKPRNRVWREIYFGYLRLFVPLFGRVFCGNAGAYSYILESLNQYPAQYGVAEEMRALGLEAVRIIQFLGGAMSINYGEKHP